MRFGSQKRSIDCSAPATCVRCAPASPLHLPPLKMFLRKRFTHSPIRLIDDARDHRQQGIRHPASPARDGTLVSAALAILATLIATAFVFWIGVNLATAEKRLLYRPRRLYTSDDPNFRRAL